MRFDSSAEARSTTPWAEIDDIVCWNKCTLSRCLSPSRSLARARLSSLLTHSLALSLVLSFSVAPLQLQHVGSFDLVTPPLYPLFLLSSSSPAMQSRKVQR